MLETYRLIEMPRRHGARHHALPHGPGPRTRLFVSYQRHRSHGPGAVTRLAFFLKNGRNVPGKSDRCLPRGPVGLRLRARRIHAHGTGHQQHHCRDGARTENPGTPHGLHLDASSPQLLGEILTFRAASIAIVLRNYALGMPTGPRIVRSVKQKSFCNAQGGLARHAAKARIQAHAGREG